MSYFKHIDGTPNFKETMRHLARRTKPVQVDGRSLMYTLVPKEGRKVTDLDFSKVNTVKEIECVVEAQLIKMGLIAYPKDAAGRFILLFRLHNAQTAEEERLQRWYRFIHHTDIREKDGDDDRESLMWVGIKSHIVNGISGSQVAPLVTHVNRTAELIKAKTFKEASDIMEAKMLPLREAMALKPEENIPGIHEERPNRWDFEVIHITK